MTLLIDDDAVRNLLPMVDCVRAMEDAFVAYDEGSAINYPRRVRLDSATPNPGWRFHTNIHIGMVPKYDAAAVRVGSYRRSVGGQRGMTDHQYMNRSWGLVYLYRLETAELLAIVHEFTLSGLRVGATDAVAAKYLARPGASTIGQFGSGKIAEADLEAMVQVHPIRTVKVFSPHPEHRTAYARKMSARLEIEVVPVNEPAAVVDGVDVICCSSSSMRPVLDGAWLEPGQLVISVATPGRDRLPLGRSERARFTEPPPVMVGEVDETTLVRSDAIVLNSEETHLYERQVAITDQIERGLFTWDKVYELGAVVRGRVTPRQRPEDLIYYRNNCGMGIQMAAAGAIIYENALKEGVGRELPTEWFGVDLSPWHERGYFPSM